MRWANADGKQGEKLYQNQIGFLFFYICNWHTCEWRILRFISAPQIFLCSFLRLFCFPHASANGRWWWFVPSPFSLHCTLATGIVLSTHTPPISIHPSIPFAHTFTHMHGFYVINKIIIYDFVLFPKRFLRTNSTLDLFIVLAEPPRIEMKERQSGIRWLHQWISTDRRITSMCVCVSRKHERRWFIAVRLLNFDWSSHLFFFLVACDQFAFLRLLFTQTQTHSLTWEFSMRATFFSLSLPLRSIWFSKPFDFVAFSLAQLYFVRNFHSMQWRAWILQLFIILWYCTERY